MILLPMMNDIVPKKILVVDDEEEILIHLGSILKRANYEVTTAKNGKEALELARNIKPDLVILDILMPGISGGEVAHTLSKIPSTQNTPIIFLSGLNTPEDAEIIREKTGNYRVLGKPITGQEVLDTVSKVLAGA